MDVALALEHANGPTGMSESHREERVAAGSRIIAGIYALTSVTETLEVGECPWSGFQDLSTTNCRLGRYALRIQRRHSELLREAVQISRLRRFADHALFIGLLHPHFHPASTLFWRPTLTQSGLLLHLTQSSNSRQGLPLPSCRVAGGWCPCGVVFQPGGRVVQMLDVMHLQMYP